MDNMKLQLFEGGQITLMESGLKTNPVGRANYIRQFIGRWFITYTEMGVPNERRFQATRESLENMKGPVYQKLAEYAEEVARRFAKWPSNVVLRAWDLGVMNWRLDGNNYPTFDISVLLMWLKKYVSQAADEIYPDGWPGQVRHVEPYEEKQLPMPEKSFEDQWMDAQALKEFEPDTYKMWISSGASTDLANEIGRRIKEENPRLYKFIVARARRSFRMELGRLLNRQWKSFRGKSSDDLKRIYGDALRHEFPSRRFHLRVELFKYGRQVFQ